MLYIRRTNLAPNPISTIHVGEAARNDTVGTANAKLNARDTRYCGVERAYLVAFLPCALYHRRVKEASQR